MSNDIVLKQAFVSGSIIDNVISDAKKEMESALQELNKQREDLLKKVVTKELNKLEQKIDAIKEEIEESSNKIDVLNEKRYETYDEQDKLRREFVSSPEVVELESYLHNATERYERYMKLLNKQAERILSDELKKELEDRVFKKLNGQ
jgi:predicted  nucleic acid-binding Zn-ribbon protein